MSEHENAPAAGEVTEPTTVQITKRLQELTAELKSAAEQNTNAKEALAKTEALRDEIRQEQARMAEAAKAKTVPTRGARVTVRDIVAGRMNTGLEAEFKRLNDDAIIRMAIRGKAVLENVGGEQVMRLPSDPEAWKGIPEYEEIRLKAVGDMWEGTTTGDGAEWVPTSIDTMAENFYAIRGGLLASLRRLDIPRGVGSRKVPVVMTEVEPSVIGEQTDAQSTLFATATFNQGTTAAPTLTPKKHLQVQGVSVEGTEDMAVEAVGLIRSELSQTLVGAVESAVISGQTSGDTSFDGSNRPNAANGYAGAGPLDVHGLRTYGFAAAARQLDNSGAALVTADGFTARQAMGKYAVNPNDCCWVMSPAAYLSLLDDTSVLTVDKYGPAATVQTGELAKFAGIPLVVSDKFPENLNATGNQNAATGATTGACLFNKRQWTLGMARNISIAMIPVPGYDIVNLVGSVRSHFVNHRDGDATAYYIFNVAEQGGTRGRGPPPGAHLPGGESMKIRLTRACKVPTKAIGLEGAPYTAALGAVLEFKTREAFDKWAARAAPTSYEVIEDKPKKDKPKPFSKAKE